MRKFIFQRLTINQQFLISITAVALVCGFGLTVYSLFDYRLTAFLLLVTVSILAMFLDIVPVLIAAVLSALLWDFLFIPPRFTLTVGTPEDRLLLIMYFVVALINAVLTNRIRQLEKIMQRNADKEKSVRFYTTLLNSLSHELRTPITTIIGCTDNLQHSAKLTDMDKRELVQEISIASVRLNQQVENLLSMSRIEAGMFQIKKDWCDVHDLVHKTLHRLDANLQRYRLAIDIPDNLPLFKLDFGLMEQVLYNLVINVTQHTPEDTLITIQAHDIDDKLVMTIADNGSGFPEHEMPFVFDKFYRLQGSRAGGTGLGLSIVKGFVEAHNGIIVLENLPIRGSKFTIEIPTEKSFLNKLKDE